MRDSFSYANTFAALRAHLIDSAPATTSETTKAIKQYFRNSFGGDRQVLCSHAENSEFGIDILVTSFKPKNIIEKKTLKLTASNIEVFLAVESELGGVSASSAYGVMKNVVEDYLKLLITRSEKRIMIMTSLPYKNEVKHVENRVERLREIYALIPELISGVLVVHLAGKRGRSTQVQTEISEASIRGFIIANNGKSVTEIPLPASAA